MINKREFSIHDMKKVLHKHGKQWIVVSAALLMMLGGGAMATKVSHADSVNNAQANVKVVNNQQPTVTSQAKNLHSQILNNASQKSATQNPTQQGTASPAKVENYQPVQVNNGAGKLVSLQKLYTLYENLAASGIFNDNSNNTTPVKPNNTPVQPSDHNNNQPVKPSDNSNNQPAKQNSKYLVQNDNNQAAFIFNDTSDFNNDVHPTLMFHDVSDPDTPSVNVVDSTQVNGYNLNRIHDTNNGQYNGWVLSDQLNSDQSKKANSQTLANFLKSLKQSNSSKYLIPNDNNSDAFIFSDTSDFKNDIKNPSQPYFHDDISAMNTPVKIIDNTTVDGYNLDRIANTKNSQYNGWVLSDQLSSDLGKRKVASSQTLASFLNALKQSNNQSQVDATHQYLDADAAHYAMVFKDRNNFMSDIAVNDVNGKPTAHTDTSVIGMPSSSKNPLVHIIDHAEVAGFKFDRVSDANDSKYNSWVFANSLSNTQNSSYSYKQVLQDFLNALGQNGSKQSDQIDAAHQYLVNSDNATPIFSDVDNIAEDFQDPNHPLYTEVKNSSDPIVHVINNVNYKGFNFDRISDSSNHNYDGWVFADALNNQKNNQSYKSELSNFLNVLQHPTKYLVQNDNNQAAFVFNDTSDFNKDVNPTLMFHDLSDQSEPSVNIIGSTTVDGFNLDRIHDNNDSRYNGWVLSDQLNSDQSQKASHQTLVDFLNALKKDQANNKKKNNKPTQFSDMYVLKGNSLLDNTNLVKLESIDKYQTVPSDNGFAGHLVKVIGKQDLDGHTFYQIDPSNKGHFWIYAGDLSNNKNAKPSDIDLTKLQSDIYNKYADAHASDVMQGVKKHAVSDINKIRSAHGLSNVVENQNLDNFADQLANQYTSENIFQGNIVTNDMTNNNIPYDGNQEVGYFTSITNTSNFNDSDPADYNNISGSDMAANINDDSASNYRSGHGVGDDSQLLNDDARFVGIGTAYHNHQMYVVEYMYDGDENSIPNIPGNGAPSKNVPNTPSHHTPKNNNRKYAQYTTNYGADNNNITSNGDGAVITAGDNNNVTANGSVIINGNNNNVTANGTVIDNGENNNVTNSGRTVYNDYTGNDSAFQSALADGVAVDASHSSNANIVD